jgi:hypothetical protein
MAKVKIELTEDIAGMKKGTVKEVDADTAEKAIAEGWAKEVKDKK